MHYLTCYESMFDARMLKFDARKIYKGCRRDKMAWDMNNEMK